MAVLEIYLEILTNFFEILHPPLCSILVLECCLHFSEDFLYGVLLRDLFSHKVIIKIHTKN